MAAINKLRRQTIRQANPRRITQAEMARIPAALVFPFGIAFPIIVLLVLFWQVVL